MNRRRFLSCVLAGLLALGVLPRVSRGETITLRTSDSQFLAGTDNQGWWNFVSPGSTTTNDNYMTGTTGSGIVVGLGGESRSFFTFDLASVLHVTSAILRLTRGTSSTENESSETLQFFDVTTDAATLNYNVGPNATIFSDLGSGDSYGTFQVLGSRPTDYVEEFNLSSAAVADMNSAVGGFFSIGGRLTTDDGDDGLFGLSQNYTAQLVIQGTRAPAVPAPTTAVGLLSMAAVALALAAYRRMGRK